MRNYLRNGSIALVGSLVPWLPLVPMLKVVASLPLRVRPWIRPSLTSRSPRPRS